MSRVAANIKVRNIWTGVFCMLVFMAVIRLRAHIDGRAQMALPCDDLIRDQLLAFEQMPGVRRMGPGDFVYAQAQMLIAAGYAVVEQLYGVDREPSEHHKEHARGARRPADDPSPVSPWQLSSERLDSS